MSFSFSLFYFKCDRVRDRWWHELRFRLCLLSLCVSLCVCFFLSSFIFIHVVQSTMSFKSIPILFMEFVCDYGLLIGSHMSFKCDINDNYMGNLSDSQICSPFFSWKGQSLTFLLIICSTVDRSHNHSHWKSGHQIRRDK